MAITAKPAAGTYTVNTGAAWCPDLLYMVDEGTGTTLTNKGKGSANNGTLAAAGTGSAPSWTTIDSQAGLQFTRGTLSTDGGILTSANLQGCTTGYTGIVIAKFTSFTNINSFLFGSGVSSQTYIFDAMYVNNSFNNLSWYNNYTNFVSADSLLDMTDSTIQMFAIRVQANALGVSVDNATWAQASAYPTTWPTQDSTRNIFRAGATADSSPDECGTFQLLGVAVYADQYIGQTDLGTIYNSGDPWTSFGVTASSFNPAWARGSNILIGVGQ